LKFKHLTNQKLEYIDTTRVSIHSRRNH
jgi:hypothetical protein